MDLNRYTRAAAGIMLGFALTIPLELSVSSAAYATPAAPNLSAGYYVNTADSSIANKVGCADGQYDTQHGYTSRLAILEFGVQNSSGIGTQLVGFGPITNAQIEDVAEQYGLGYYDCSGNAQNMIVAVATNNSASSGPSYSNGQAWHGVLHAIWTSNIAATILSQVNFIGGNDVEAWQAPGYNATPGPVVAWSNGWTSSTTGLYLNLGSADGCPQTSYSGGNGGSCNNGFNQYDYWYLSWGNPDAIVEPQIYFSGQAPEWKWICIYGNNVKGKSISFEGPLDEYYMPNNGGAYSPAAAWSQLWNALNGTVCTQTPVFSTGIKNE